VRRIFMKTELTMCAACMKMTKVLYLILSPRFLVSEGTGV